MDVEPTTIIELPLRTRQQERTRHTEILKRLLEQRISIQEQLLADIDLDSSSQQVIADKADRIENSLLLLMQRRAPWVDLQEFIHTRRQWLKRILHDLDPNQECNSVYIPADPKLATPSNLSLESISIQNPTSTASVRVYQEDLTGAIINNNHTTVKIFQRHPAFVRRTSTYDYSKTPVRLFIKNAPPWDLNS